MAAWSLRMLKDIGAGVRTLPSARPGANARAQPRRIRLWTRTVRTACICQLSGISRIRTARGTAPTTTSSMRDGLLLALFFGGRNTPGRRQDLSKTADLRRLHEPQRAMCGGARLVVDQRVGAEFGAPLPEGPPRRGGHERPAHAPAAGFGDDVPAFEIRDPVRHAALRICPD